MRRFILIPGLLAMLIALSIPVVFAQVETTPTPDPNQALQPVNTPVIPPTAVVQPELGPTQAPPAFSNEVLQLLVASRTDLENLADQVLGFNPRPAGWSGSLDITDPQLAVLLRLDLDLLMANLLGLDNIPEGWFGAVPSTAQAIARDIRHDLELLADTLLGFSIRPQGWSGGDPIMRCDRSTQNLVQLLQRNSLFTPNVLASNPNYCALLASQVGQFAEIKLLTQQSAPIFQPDAVSQVTTDGESSSRSVPTGTHFAVENFGLAFLNRYATRMVGTVPTDIPFTPVARSYTQFSHMTLVQGDNFEIFVDYKTTTIDENTFQTLPNVNTYPANPFCAAGWCQPERRIAPFGSRTSQTLSSTGLVNASTNMVIHYDGDDQNGMTRVRMELCDRATSTNQAVCEPATEVVLPDGTVSVPVGTVNGLLQFYAPYAYSTSSVRSENFYTIDLWIDPPDLRD